MPATLAPSLPSPSVVKTRPAKGVAREVCHSPLRMASFEPGISRTRARMRATQCCVVESGPGEGGSEVPATGMERDEKDGRERALLRREVVRSSFRLGREETRGGGKGVRSRIVPVISQ